MNIFELDAASNNSVDDIRRLVEQVRIPPQTGQYKVYIIDEVHMLSTSAFNAFLKTLEEPPAYAKFILATTEKHKIIPTILSRCQIFDFKRIKTEDITKHLEYVAKQENISYEYEALHIIAQKAEGGLRDALSMFDQLVNFTGANLSYTNCIDNLNVLDYEYYFRLLDYFRTGNISQSLLLYQEILDKGFDGQHFITGLSEHIRNLMVCLDPITQTLLDVSENIKYRYSEQAINCGLGLLLKYLEISSDFEYRYRDANNKRLFIEVALTKLSAVTNKLAVVDIPTSQPQQALVNAADTRQMQQPSPNTIQQISKPSTPQTPIQTVSNSMENKVDVKTPPQLKIPTKTSTISIASPNSNNIPNIGDEKKNKQLDLTQEKLDELWYKYIKELDSKDEEDKQISNLKFTMSQSKCLLRGNNLFSIELSNSYSEEILKKNRMEILTFMRGQTGIRELDFLTTVQTQEGKKALYSPAEKYEFMLEQNPKLHLYQQLFKDIDY
jgi:DNA polymerase-3 subunit gamma/tau